MKEGRNYTVKHYDDSSGTFRSSLSYDDSRQHYPSNYDRTSQFGHSSSQFDRFSTRDPYSSTGAYQHQSQMTMQRSKEGNDVGIFIFYSISHNTVMIIRFIVSFFFNQNWDNPGVDFNLWMYRFGIVQYSVTWP